MHFLINSLERNIGIDLNGDGYIGGEGWLSKLERFTHIDFNRDNIIGRPPDVIYGYPTLYRDPYGPFAMINGGRYPFVTYSPGPRF